ncbi:N-formylglutamate amidohydrolase [uncultured Hyphomicrobium sp.]|uniref:N-formylglutamate amidohydrolase n=1 Tax=uncultured Hyphomicrobium sp. TaxID=194373 RepID=UPI0025DCCFC7|nr:N-formylglutamate amidohydrolase [uncultured Hyphomicrobium sp.]
MPIRPENGANTGVVLEAQVSEAYVRRPGSLASGAILLCDHAANALPDGYETLGLPQAEFERHIAYDIGAQGVTEELATMLGAPAVMTRFSRLLIDCNRGEDDPTLIMRVSDGAIIPGNRVLASAEREKRHARFYRPYHVAVDEVIDRALAHGVAPVLLSVHSFTPVWRGLARPWHAAVLWDKDPRLALPLLAALRADPALVVGDNEPYHGALRGDCMWQHGTSRGLAHALIEIRQDLIASEKGQREWAAKLATAMRHILADPALDHDLKTIRHFGSHTD